MGGLGCEYRRTGVAGDAPFGGFRTAPRSRDPHNGAAMPPVAIRLPVAPPFELWLVRLAQSDEVADTGLLDAQERERARRFRFERDRRRHVDAHVALRQVLADRTGRSAAALEFEAGAFGKPRVAGAPRCEFSLSHSDDLALIALADEGEIGVDIERVRALPDLDALARQCLAADELRALEALPTADRAFSFLQTWTRKEACLKALGLGLQIEPASFSVGRATDATQASIATPCGMCIVHVHTVEPADGWVGALAYVTERSQGG